ncbi:MAG: indole-3-glycerol phosphate synthase TrpC [Candidatus Acidiferrales bacterium]
MVPETKSGNMLDRIVEARRASVAHRQRVLPQAVLRMGVEKAEPVRDFPAALTRDGLNIIAELKKASPSRGVLRSDFDPATLAAQFEQAGAVALSVLTEEEFFQGDLNYMRQARKRVALPVLRKDFIVDPWQIWESRATNADSFLLIVAALTQDSLRDFLALGRELGMESLVEIHSRAELDRALEAGARVMGVNNRDLRTLEVRVETSFELIELIPDDRIAVAESGLRSHEDLQGLRAAGFDAFLIGEHLMTQSDSARALSDLLRPSAG